MSTRRNQIPKYLCSLLRLQHLPNQQQGMCRVQWLLRFLLRPFPKLPQMQGPLNEIRVQLPHLEPSLPPSIKCMPSMIPTPSPVMSNARGVPTLGVTIPYLIIKHATQIRSLLQISKLVLIKLVRSAPQIILLISSILVTPVIILVTSAKILEILNVSSVHLVLLDRTLI